MNSGLKEAKRIYEEGNTLHRLPQWRNKPVIGYMCAYAPLELIWAGGMIPWRITGNPAQPISKADEYFETIMCPYVRNCFDQALKDPNNKPEGLVMSHTCDSIYRVAGLWNHYVGPEYFHVVNVPHKTAGAAKGFFKNELLFFKESLEKFIGHEIESSQIVKAIDLYNDNRRLIRDIYEFRKKNPPLISGVEMLYVLVAGCRIDPEAFNSILRTVRGEVSARRMEFKETSPRVMVYGCIIDQDDLYNLIETSGAYVVADDTCIGSRIYTHDVALTEDPLDGLVDTYFEKFECPRTVKNAGSDRFNYIFDIVDSFLVDGVILYALDFCDPHKFDIPTLRDLLQERGHPVLYLEDDYSKANIVRLKTRIQAFVEMMVGGNNG